MALRNAIPPADVRLTKHYFKNHIEEIKRQLQVVKDLGPGSAEEWIKGLENEGQERYNDAARWEQWELKGGLKKVNIRPNSKTAPSMAGQTIALVPSAKVLPKSRNGNNKQVITEEDPAASVYPLSTASETTSRALQSSTYIPSTAHMALPPRPQIAISQVRPERNIRDVIEAKAARRAEIERRCLSLDPPLEANVLFHMESFQAALQISTTLTDSAWEILKPRLLAQRESAEYRERERVLQSELLQARSEERKHQEAQLKETKELLDKEWDTIQAPIRERLGVFADEFIKASWAGGSSVTKDNCPTFAADVLLYARRRFYDDVAQGDNARHVARENVRSESPNDSPTSKLNLENMKWLFDNKIKNFTENFQKDLFLCNGCDGNFKFYGFEGVIQHYAAKHTTSLSMGSVVVHWRAEWPDPPPFNPNPNVAKAPYYSVPLPTSTSAQNQFSRPPQPMALYDEYAQMAAPSIQPPLGHSSQYSTSSYQAHYPVQLHNGHYPDVSTIPNGYSQLSNYDGPLVISQPPMQYHTSRPENPVVLGHDYHSFSENSATHLQLNRSNTSFNLYTPAAQQPAYPQPYLPRQQGGSYRSSLPTISPVNPLPTYPTRTASDYQPKNMPGPDLYNIHMNEMAHQASCVWMETSGIKDIPQSVRIFIVIHHTIVRFMQKYAIEPSLAMFIDCLDHNPLMRPVRSLNGLACKTCVTRGNNSGDEYHSHPRRKATDRKLYTLPHLLNHFKTIHVERMQSAMDLRSGPESSRLDWKQDMIELPETPLIANLVNAPGTDSSKFQLIATVFPNIFPVSLPIKGYIEYTEPNFAHGRRHNGAIVRPYDGSSALEIAPTSPSQAEIQAHSDTLTPLRPESFLQTSSRTSTRPSEPPGDDEYDPNRPAYYGKMIDSRQFAPRKVLNEQSSAEVVRMRRTAMPQLGSTHDIANSQDSQPQPPREERARSDDDQAEGMGRHEALHLIAARSSVMGHGTTASFRAATGLGKNRSFNFEDSSRYVSEDGELIEEPTSVLQNHISASDVADVTAAERFLNEIYPGVGQNGDQTEEDPSARGSRSLHSKQNTVGILSHQQLGSVGRAAEVVAVKRTEDNTQYNIRSTPWFTEHIEPRSSDNLPHPHIPNDHRQFFDPLSYSGPRARHQYTAHPYPAGELSTRVDDARTTCHEAHISPGIDEHLISTFRNARKPSQWLDTEIRRRRSRSPVLVACTLEQYRAQSPRQRSPHVSSYHVKPPIPPSDGHLRRIIQYACPIDQNDVARPRMAGYPEEHYGQRIEYIPIQEDHHGYQDKDGYMIAQPVEQMRSTDQILMERTYVQDEVIEADRHLYYAARRQADARPIRTTNPAYFEYRGI
ncbi:hypothetical protein MMC26_007320 [Xylographa opegraphella]|nr:hypothetical protein [Xylographa opegraphella]